MSNWRTTVRLWTKEFMVHTPLRKYVLPRYLYNFTAAQLCYMCACLDRTRAVPGKIVEVGVAGGETTLFLNNYLTAEGIDKEYLAVDTFAGFIPADIQYEVTQRGKDRARYIGVEGFQINKQAWYDLTMRLNRVTRVRSLRADVNQFDLRSLGAISFCLLDIDLYLPMKKALGELYEVLSIGGVMVVDDCSLNDARYDGSLQAYQEFIREIGKTDEIVHRKLGIVTK
ncbi:MAG TPA: TylF/MycF/NovP-related O-methyltransferase [Anaerolineae bacterium]|nr:TylF/MycF/NovP-related O-methyltransferase [Anaerolineae bacterium]